MARELACCRLTQADEKCHSQSTVQQDVKCDEMFAMLFVDNFDFCITVYCIFDPGCDCTSHRKMPYQNANITKQCQNFYYP